jgi:hypothetical protein
MRVYGLAASLNARWHEGSWPYSSALTIAAMMTACLFGFTASARAASTVTAQSNRLDECATSYKASDESLCFYPSTARAMPDGRVAVRIEAWVYESESRPGLRSILARYLKIDRDALSEEERKRYDARTQLFLFDSERGKEMQVIGSGGEHYAMPKTRGNGRSRAQLILPSPAREDVWLPFRGVLAQRRGDTAPVYSEGRALWVPDTGLSVVSDIDDTIKDSNVLVRRELLLNTFVRPFVAVQGMAARYRGFAQARRDLRVHYVSGSPHQLYPALSEFLEGGGFPPGSVHLRDVDVSKELFGAHGGTRAHKLAAIRSLIADFPRRSFVLIGDSGEQDPEIYATIAREYPRQVLGVWIRDVTKQSREHSRYAKTFSGVDSTKWHVFNNAEEIVFP